MNLKIDGASATSKHLPVFPYPGENVSFGGPMTFLVQNIRQIHEPGQIIVFWLGGSGFLFKFGDGTVLCIDPYLSDAVERTVGFRRLSLPPIQANELPFDLLLISHDHRDHCDQDSLTDFITTNPNGRIIAAKSCTTVLAPYQYQIIFVDKGDAIAVGSLRILAVPCDHGELCAEAIGFLIEYGNRTIYFTGDTSLNLDLLSSVIAEQPEVILPCINGAYGNMNEVDAALLAKLCGSKKAIPAHFWLFSEHGGNPDVFRQNLNKYAPATELILLTPGRGVVI